MRVLVMVLVMKKLLLVVVLLLSVTILSGCSDQEWGEFFDPKIPNNILP
jgi:uncharacterized lipoprotein YehR (DUF1307 family)